MIRLAYYGDDFSGSSDVLEVLCRAGVRTRMYLQVPKSIEPGIEAIGVAGISRSLPTEQMEDVLRPIFESLRTLPVKQVHYKVCSTFDSSPTIGSIGRALDIGAEVFQPETIPIVVGSPNLGRYVAFGNLFARSGQDRPVERLDRHPTMSCHPVTPMREADLRRVLREQTQRTIELVDVPTLDRWGVSGVPSLGPGVVLLDTVSPHHLVPIGEAVWRLGEPGRPAFAIGSSGLHSALVAYWQASGELATTPKFHADAVDRILAVCGSCSPVTARQIDWAVAHGFAEIALEPGDWQSHVTANRYDHEISRRLAERSVIVHAARGPNDARIQSVNQSGPKLGRYLAGIVNRALERNLVTRVAVAGGDTSGYVCRALNVIALDFVASIAPGSPLCRMVAPDSPAHQREIIFKGGQVGKADFFELVRTGQEQT
jgi:uncharacterized protein YgbK (DUF1537 family)